MISFKKEDRGNLAVTAARIQGSARCEGQADRFALESTKFDRVGYEA